MGRAGAGVRRSGCPRSSCSASLPPRTAATARAGSSRGIAAGTSCSRGCTAPEPRTRPTSVARDDGLAPDAASTCRRSTGARRRGTGRPRRSAIGACRSSSGSSRRSLEVRTIVVSGLVRVGRRAARARLDAVTRTRPKPRFGHGAEAAVGALRAGRVLPPEPAEHLHRQAHARRCSTRSCGARSWWLPRRATRAESAGAPPLRRSPTRAVRSVRGAPSEFLRRLSGGGGRPTGRSGDGPTCRRHVPAVQAKVAVVGLAIVVTATLGVVNPLLIKAIFDNALFGDPQGDCAGAALPPAGHAVPLCRAHDHHPDRHGRDRGRADLPGQPRGPAGDAGPAQRALPASAEHAAAVLHGDAHR